jgi:hypothetical protein
MNAAADHNEVLPCHFYDYSQPDLGLDATRAKFLPAPTVTTAVLC